MEEVFIKVGDSGVDETTLTASGAQNKASVVENTPLINDITKNIGEACIAIHKYTHAPKKCLCSEHKMAIFI